MFRVMQQFFGTEAKKLKVLRQSLASQKRFQNDHAV